MRAYNNRIIPSVGTFVGEIESGGDIFDVRFVVTKDHSQPIIGLATCLKLGFFEIPSKQKHVLKVHGVCSKVKVGGSNPVGGISLATEMFQKYPKVFEGLGQFKDPYKIKLRMTINQLYTVSTQDTFSIQRQN